jgi:hypothetical protein
MIIEVTSMIFWVSFATQVGEPGSAVFAYLRYGFTSNGFLLPYAKVFQYFILNTTHIRRLLLYD